MTDTGDIDRLYLIIEEKNKEIKELQKVIDEAKALMKEILTMLES